MNEEDFCLFRQRMTDNLDRISYPYNNATHDHRICCNDEHKVPIENYYGDIVAAVLDAEKCLPKVLPNVQRSFWCDKLAVLKQKLID